MAQAGYDPTAMLDVMRILKEASREVANPSFWRLTPCQRLDSRRLRRSRRGTIPMGFLRISSWV